MLSQIYINFPICIDCSIKYNLDIIPSIYGTDKRRSEDKQILKRQITHLWDLLLLVNSAHNILHWYILKKNAMNLWVLCYFQHFCRYSSQFFICLIFYTWFYWNIEEISDFQIVLRHLEWRLQRLRSMEEFSETLREF